MRILRIDLEGFGPFRDRQVLDFERAAEGGILLITGRTGAGKSSILDAVSFALYGSVPRYDGQVGRVRSDHLPADRGARVALDFEMAGERFRVERTPEWERPKRRGAGTTVQKPEARLWRWDPAVEEWEGIAARPVDVAAELSPVLGLSHEQFLQVVLLAQGGFQRFLRAGDQERQATLRTLFRTQRFAEVERLLGDRRKQLADAAELREARTLGLLEQLESVLAQDAVEAGSTATDADGPGADEPGAGDPGADDPGAGDPETGGAVAPQQADDDSERARVDAAAARPVGARRDAAAAAIETFETVVAGLAAIATRATDERAEAERVHRDAEELAARQKKRAAAAERAEELAARAPEIQRLRETAEAARRAALAADPLAGAERDARASERADELRERAIAEVRAAREAERVGAAEGESPADHGNLAPGQDRRWSALRELRDRAAADLALLARAEAAERRRGELAAERERAASAVAAAASEVARLRSRTEALPAEVGAARAELEATAALAAGAAARRSAVERSEAIAAAAAEADRLAPRLAAAEAESASLAEEAARAAGAVSALLARRLAGMAGELAADLSPGEACAVCGATEHPAPAERHDPVGEEEIAAAEQAQTRAQRALDAARSAERALAEARTAAVAAAAGSDPDAANAALLAAREELAEAERAERALDAQRTRLSGLETELHRASEGLVEAGNERTRHESARDALTERLAELDAELVRERAGFATVGDRARAVERVRSAADAALDAALAAEAAADARSRSAAALDAALERAGFRSADEARAAALPEPELARIDASIEAHVREVQRTDDALADPELRELPAEPAPVAESAARLDAAVRAAREAASAEATARERLASRRSQLARIDDELRGAARGDAELTRLRRLADAVQGKEPNTRRMRLEAFVLAARLEAIVDAANQRLARMVGGRYRLQHDDGPRSRGRQSGLGLSVLDEYTGRERSTDSLSGGETFLASLALALGLADVVTAESGGIRLDTLFIDEGFGTLDPDALDQALATLDTLREGGRTVALISHVAELRERLPAQLEVIVDDRGVSGLRGEGVIAADAAERENT